MPVLFGALAAMFCALGLATIPMLRDQGPVERLRGGAMAPERRDRSSLTLRLVNWLAARLGPRLVPGVRGTPRAPLEHPLGPPRPPGAQTLPRLLGPQGAMGGVLRPRGGGG